MQDYANALKVLKSPSIGYATAESRIGFLRGVQFKNTRSNWAFKPENRQARRKQNGRFVKRFAAAAR